MKITEIEIAKSVNTTNCVWVDFGDTDGYHKEKILPNGDKLILPTDLGYTGFEGLKRSGKVLNAPKRFIYSEPFDPEYNKSLMSEKIETPFVEKDDIVFFEPETKSWCEHNGYKLQTETGVYVYIVPYRFLICTIKKATNEIIMLNGKILVERDMSLIKEVSSVIDIEKKYDNSKSNWCKVVNVNNFEGYSGTWKNGSYTDWKSIGQYLEKGTEVLVKKYASFELQPMIKESVEIEELQDVYSVERKKIIAYRENEKHRALPYGVYIKVLLDKDYAANKDLYEMSKSGIWVKRQKEPFKGTVYAVGCAVNEVVVGDKILFTNMSNSIDAFDDFVYIIEDWVMMRGI